LKEMETRIIDIDADEIRSKLLKIGAVKVKSENQQNKIFDFNDRRLLENKGYARIRTVEDMLHNEFHYYMTTKKIISQDKFKTMSENEVEISHADIGEKIFMDLGLKLVQSINKYRESYSYKNVLVEIDINDKSFCPFPYIEIEAENEDNLEEIVELLGYNMSDTTSKTIYEILGKKGVIKGL
jgi:adenylate cyclase class 2